MKKDARNAIAAAILNVELYENSFWKLENSNGKYGYIVIQLFYSDKGIVLNKCTQ